MTPKKKGVTLAGARKAARTAKALAAADLGSFGTGPIVKKMDAPGLKKSKPRTPSPIEEFFSNAIDRAAEFALYDFIRESNRIEGIMRYPLQTEVDAHKKFLARDHITIEDLCDFVHDVADGAPLRDKPGLDVVVGDHRPIRGGPEVPRLLRGILHEANERANRRDGLHAYRVHVAYETLHPFCDGNGRSGRVLWLWMNYGHAPLGFLHSWYYSSLQALR